MDYEKLKLYLGKLTSSIDTTISEVLKIEDEKYKIVDELHSLMDSANLISLSIVPVKSKILLKLTKDQAKLFSKVVVQIDYAKVAVEHSSSQKIPSKFPHMNKSISDIKEVLSRLSSLLSEMDIILTIQKRDLTSLKSYNSKKNNSEDHKKMFYSFSEFMMHFNKEKRLRRKISLLADTGYHSAYLATGNIETIYKEMETVKHDIEDIKKYYQLMVSLKDDKKQVKNYALMIIDRLQEIQKTKFYRYFKEDIIQMKEYAKQTVKGNSIGERMPGTMLFGAFLIVPKTFIWMGCALHVLYKMKTSPLPSAK